MRLTLLILGGLLVFQSVVGIVLGIIDMPDPVEGYVRHYFALFDSEWLRLTAGLTAIAVSNILSRETRKG